MVADTEDDSPDLERVGRSGFEKKITQVAGIDGNGRCFHFRPRVKRVLQRNGFKQYVMDLEPFYNWLVNQGEMRCYFHNTRYDLGNLFPTWCGSGPAPEARSYMIPFDALDISMVGNRLISARWRNITFLDSFNLWPMALAKVGAAVGIKKQDMNVRSRAYVDNDCRIVRKAIQVVQRLCEEFEVNLPATLGSLCVALWMALDGSNWHWADSLAREAYYGGRVELFCKGGAGDILYTDINSLYPHCMTFAYPMAAENYGLGKKQVLPKWGIATVTLDVPKCHIAPLPVERPDGSIIYPWGRIEGTYTCHEIRNAIKHGARLVTLHDSYGSDHGFPYYAKFVKQFYQRRKMVLPTSETPDAGTALFLKLLLNNLYGQLGMSGLVTRSLVLDRWIERDALDSPILMPNGEPKLRREGTPYGKKLLAEIQMPLPAHANYLHAAYVTSYARLVLQDYLRRVPERDLIYCDTDSLFFFSNQFKPVFPIGNELGQMKIEAQASWCEVQGPKFYALQTSKGKFYKAKGIPNRKLPSWRRSRHGKTYPEIFHKAGRVEFQQPFGLRESIRYYDRQLVNGFDEESRALSVWHPVEKNALAQYDKKQAVTKGGKLFYQPIENDGT